MASYPLLAISILLAVVGQLSLKRGMSRRPGFRVIDVIALAGDVAIVGGFCCYGVSMLLYFKALETLPLSVAYPALSLGYAMVVILSGVFLKEPLDRARWGAVAVICIGVALVGLGA